MGREHSRTRVSVIPLPRVVLPVEMLDRVPFILSKMIKEVYAAMQMEKAVAKLNKCPLMRRYQMQNVAFQAREF